MPSAGLRAVVPPISSEPLPHSLLGGCVDVITTTDLHELLGTDMMSMSCAVANGWQDCPTADSNPTAGPYTNPAEKVFDRSDWCSFEPITAYAGVECSTFGISYEEAQARALEQLRMGEQRVVEDFYMRRGLAVMALGNDLTPVAGALHIASGVGVLENWLANNFGGQGMIHVPAGAASLLSLNTLVDFASEETCPTTLLGNKVILGAGYTANVGPYTAPLTPGAVAPAGEAWLYITPPVRVRRDTPQLVQRSEWQTVNTVINDRRALAESTFVVETSCCIAAAVRVSLDACC